MQFSRRTVKIGIVLAIVLAIAAISYGLYRNQQASLGSVEIRIAPKNATVRIDDAKAQSVKNGQTLRLKEGNRKLSFSQSGYETKTIYITVQPQETQTSYVHLVSQSRSTKDDSEEARKIKHAALSAQYEKVLPVNQGVFTIDLCRSLRYESLYAICLYADSDTSKERAIDLLKNYDIPVGESEIYFGTGYGYVVYQSGDSKLLYYPSQYLDYPMMYFYAATAASAESDRQEMLQQLDDEGFDSSEFTIMYGDEPLMKYNATIEEDQDHAAAPQN